MKLKNVLIITIAILTIGLFVACNDDVVVAAKDNNVAYTQVLESNGAFEYNGTKYDTLQLALKAIVDGKGTPDVKTIKVLRDVTGPGASISAEKTIVLDLDGHTLTFIDVTDSALSVGNGTSFTVKNGSMSLFDTSNADLAVVKADGAQSLTLEGVNINTSGQYALVSDGTTNTTIDVKGGSVLTGNADISNATLSIADSSKLDGALDADDSSITLGTDDEDTSKITGEINLEGSANGKTTFTTRKSTTVTGKVTATGQHTASETVKDVALDIKNTIDSLTLENSYINIPSPGHVTVDDMGSSGNYYVAEEGYSAVTLPAGSDVVVNSGQCVVVTESMVSYYGSISEALADNKYAGATIKLLKADTQDIDENLSIGYSVDINLNGYCLNTTNESSITLADGVTLKVFNNNGSNVTEAKFKAAVTSDSNGTSNFVVGKSDDTAKIEVTGTVNVTGSFTAAKAVLDSTVSAGGVLTSGYGAEFKSTVSAASVTDGVNVTEVAGSTFKDNVTATTGALVSYKSAFTATASEKTISGSTLSISSSTFSDTNPYALTATGEDYTVGNVAHSALEITTSTGSVASLTANGGGSIKVDNSGATDTLTVTGNVSASKTANSTTTYYDVTLVGKNDGSKNVIVNGTIDGNDIELTQTTVNDNVIAHDNGEDLGSVVATSSTFDTKNVSDKKVSGSILNISTSTFAATTSGTASNFYALEASGADYVEGDDAHSALEIITSTGSVASLTANGGGSIKVDNSEATDTLTVTGNVSASKTANSTTTYYDVTLIGKNNGSKNVIVNGIIDGNDIELTRTTVNGNVIAYDVSGDNGSVVATNSTVGNSSSEDVVYSRDIRISNSTVIVAKLIKGVVVNEVSTDVPADLIHLENVIGTVVEAKVAAASTVDYSDNKAGTSADPVYYAFYLKNAFTSGDYGDNYNFNINKVTSAGGTGTSSTASEPNQTVQAVYINNANTVDRYINSAGVGETLSSIAATNGDVNVEIDSNGSSVISITGSIATTGSGNVVLKGKNSEKKITLKSSVTSAGSVTTSFCDFSPVSSGATAITSTLAYAATAPNGVVINNATGTAGAITAASGVVIDNASASATLATGTITAKSTGDTPSYYNVTVKGNSTNKVTVASIPYAADVKTSYAVVTGAIGSDTTKVATVSDGWTENSNVGKSEFNGNIYASGAGSFNNSKFAAGTISGKTLNAGTLVINNSEFKDDSNYYALEASGADYGNPSTSALKIANSTGKVASLTATAGSINVANGSANETFTVAGSVSAYGSGSTTYYDVTLTGDSDGNANVVVKGSISGNDIILGRVEAEENIYGYDNGTSDLGSVTVNNSVVGDNDTTSDNVYSRDIQISNSHIVLNRLAAGASASADTVTITDPVSGSAVANINTEDLSVTAADTYLTVTNVTASGLVTIAGGTYTNSFEITGDEDNTITAGTFGTVADGPAYGGTFSYKGTGTLYVSGEKTSTTSRYTTFYAASSFRNDSLPASSGAVTLNGSSYITDSFGPEDFGLRFYDIDSLDSSSNVFISGAWVREPDGFSSLLALVNRTDAINKVYLQYDKQDKEVLTGVHTYEFRVRPNSDASKVTVNFNSEETGSGTSYTLNKGLVLSADSSTTLNFDAGMKATGKLYVSGNGLLYSSDSLSGKVYGLTSGNVVSSEALPCIFDSNCYIYLTSYVTLDANTVIVAKGKLYSSSMEIGTPVTESPAGYQYAYYSNSANAKVYAQRGTAYVTATLATGDYTSCVLKSTIDSWGSNIMYIVWTGDIMGSGNKVWADTNNTSSWYYGYTSTTSADLGWHTSNRDSISGHHMEGGTPGTFSSTN